MCLADGVTACAFVSCCAVLCCLCWFAPLSAVGVRMARTGFSAIDIYLYTDDVARDCGAFSCLCGRAGDLCYMYGCMQGLFRVALVYICIYV